MIKLTNLIFGFSLCSIYSFAEVSLPYGTDFELSDGDALGSAPANSSWATTSSVIQVATENYYQGTQALKIASASPEHIVSLRFDAQANTTVFVDYYVQLTASGLPTLPLLTTPETTAMLALSPSGDGLAEWMLLDGDGLGAGQWGCLRQSF